MITEITDDGPTRLLVLHPESSQERDRLLETLKYPVPLNPEDMRDHGRLSLADYEVQPEGGRAAFGYVALEFQESPRTSGIDPDRHLRPMRVPSGELLSPDDLRGLWRFTPSAGSRVLPFELEIEGISAGTVDTEAFGVITGKWRIGASQTQVGITGSADGRTAVFSFSLYRELDVRLVGMFTSRSTAIATYQARSDDGFLIGQVEGLRVPPT